MKFSLATFFSNLSQQFRYTAVSEETKSTALILCVIFLVMSPPFLVINLIRDSYLLFSILLIINLGASINVFTIKKHSTYFPVITFFLILPAIIFFEVKIIERYTLVGTMWSYVFLMGLYFILPHMLAWMSSVLFIGFVTFVAYDLMSMNQLTRYFLTLSLLSLCAGVLVHIINKKTLHLEIQMNQDALTGVLNRKTLADTLAAHIQRCQQGEAASILCLDVDYFKRINDEYGHTQGDAVLVELTNFLKDTLSAEQKIFRMGGEEFLVLLPGLDRTAAFTLADSLRERISQLVLLPQNKCITVSIGVAQCDPEMTQSDWINQSDTAMYLAKKQGRNQVETAPCK